MLGHAYRRRRVLLNLEIFSVVNDKSTMILEEMSIALSEVLLY